MISIQTPRAWLMTDERLGDALLPIIGRVPEGSGVVFRHHSLTDPARATLGRAVAERCHARGLFLSVSRDAALAEVLGAAMVHNPRAGDERMPFSLSVHDASEAASAADRGATLAFVSPVYATSSHAGQPALGPEQAAALARACGCPAIALGGMDAQRFADIEMLGFAGWAGIDAWARG